MTFVHRSRLPLLIALVAAFAGCGDDDTATDGGADASFDTGPDAQRDAGPDADSPDAQVGIVAERPECENLDPHHCTMPFPSRRYLREDGSSSTGFRVDIPIDAFPRNTRGQVPERLDVFNRFDGFSPMTAMVAAFSGKLTEDNLAGEDRIAMSLSPESPTVVLDAETGERVAHMAEIDRWDAATDEETTLYLRPVVRLEENRRYIVALRNLERIDGSTVAPSAYFEALRDGIETVVPELEARREEMNSVFAILEENGIGREDLVLAWDFHTASGESIWGDTLSARNDAFARFEAGESGIGNCTVTSVEESPNPRIARRIRGTYTVPLYLVNDQPGATFFRNESGQVTFNGVAEAPFEIAVSQSARDGLNEGERAPIMMYGHGLLGTAGQVSSGGTTEALSRAGFIGYGTDYWGLSTPDAPHFINEVTRNFGNIDHLGERLVQGTINSLILQKAMASACGEMEELRFDIEGEPTPIVNANEHYYYGISQGGIMGVTLAALSDTVDRYVLQVGAIGYSHMLRRSIDFRSYEGFLGTWYRNKLDRDWWVVASQGMWDLAEPATYARHVIGEPLEGVDNSERRILYQVAEYDAQVPNTMSDAAVRTMGIPWMSGSSYEPWGRAEGALLVTDGPADSAYTIFHLDTVEPIPVGSAIADEDNDAHSDLRFMEPMLEQFVRFLRPDGQVENTCPDSDCHIENTRE